MRTKMTFRKALILLLVLGVMGGTALAGVPATDVAGAGLPAVNVEPGITRVTIPAAAGLPAPLPVPLPITGVPKVSSINDKLPQRPPMSCPASTSSIASCGGDPPPPQDVTYWWQGVFSVSSRAGVWYEFVQEFEWRVVGGQIRSVSLNICYSRNGSWHHHGCGGMGEHDGSPRIVQQNSTTMRVLAEWDYHFHTRNEYQAPNTDIRFGADGSIVGTVWYQ